MQAFQLQQPANVGAASQAFLAGGDAKFLAGGQSLMPTLKLRLAAPELLVDLGHVPELGTISVTATEVIVGAMTRHAEVAASPEVRAASPALADLAGGIGDRQVRNMGTIGGSLANSDPAACYPAAVLALNATIHTNTRSIPADQFFTGLYETALKPGEIITKVSFPRVQSAAYVKFKNPASRFALVGVFVAKSASGVRVAVTGCSSHVFRVPALEQALAASFTAASARAVKMSPEGLNTDLHANAVYRAHLIPVIAGRAVAAAR